MMPRRSRHCRFVFFRRWSWLFLMVHSPWPQAGANHVVLKQAQIVKLPRCLLGDCCLTVAEHDLGRQPVVVVGRHRRQAHLRIIHRNFHVEQLEIVGRIVQIEVGRRVRVVFHGHRDIVLVDAVGRQDSSSLPESASDSTSARRQACRCGPSMRTEPLRGRLPAAGSAFQMPCRTGSCRT